MKIRFCIFTFCFLTCLSEGRAQNLVPNSDFEFYSSCPNWTSQIGVATPWMNPADTNSFGGTSDYFNQCSTSLAGVPSNIEGYQTAHSGLGYAGLFQCSITTTTWHEYIEVQLISPLMLDSLYYLQMFVSSSGKMRKRSPSLGVYFSDTIISNVPNAHVLPFTPQINNDTTNIFDTTGWTPFGGYYLAHGGEQFIIIGNFNTDASTTLLPNNPAPPSYGNMYAYVYIDDVSLVKVFNTGIVNHSLSESALAFPNPFTDRLTVQTEEKGVSELTIYDCFSTVLLQKKFIESVSLDLNNFPAGFYNYQITNGVKVTGRGKLAKK